jgi:hypothetical protein
LAGAEVVGFGAVIVAGGEGGVALPEGAITVITGVDYHGIDVAIFALVTEDEAKLRHKRWKVRSEQQKTADYALRRMCPQGSMTSEPLAA